MKLNGFKIVCESVGLNLHKYHNMSFRDIRNELDPDGKNHDLTLVCTKCGTTHTCRCSKPKRVIHGLCNVCAGLEEKPKPLSWYKG